MTDAVAWAMTLADKLHEGQKDKAGRPYFEHLFRVAMAMPTDDGKIVGFLHDALEDVLDCKTIEEAKHLLSDHLKIKESLVETLWLLRHEENQPYMDYIQKLASDPLAVQVKLSDLKDNMDPRRMEQLPAETQQRLLKKYGKAKTYLEGLS